MRSFGSGESEASKPEHDPKEVLKISQRPVSGRRKLTANVIVPNRFAKAVAECDAMCERHINTHRHMEYSVGRRKADWRQNRRAAGSLQLLLPARKMVNSGSHREIGTEAAVQSAEVNQEINDEG